MPYSFKISLTLRIPDHYFETIVIHVNTYVWHLFVIIRHHHQIKVKVKYVFISQRNKRIFLRNPFVAENTEKEERKEGNEKQFSEQFREKMVINITAGPSSGHSKTLCSVLLISFSFEIIIPKSTSNTSSLKRK